MGRHIKNSSQSVTQTSGKPSIFAVLVIAACALIGCSSTINTQADVSEPSPNTTLSVSVRSIKNALPPSSTLAISSEKIHDVVQNLCDNVGFVDEKTDNDITIAEVIPLNSTSKAADHPFHYEWTSTWQYSDYDANPDGTLSREPRTAHWYNAHDWSDYGQAISTMEPGDTLTIDGLDVVVEERFLWSQDGYIEDIYDYTGYDAVIFQTCLPDENTVWIVACRDKHSTS